MATSMHVFVATAAKAAVLCSFFSFTNDALRIQKGCSLKYNTFPVQLICPVRFQSQDHVSQQEFLQCKAGILPSYLQLRNTFSIAACETEIRQGILKL